MRGAQVFRRNMGVNLGGGDVGVAEQHLQRAKVHPGVQKMRRERVAKRVGREFAFDAGLLTEFAEQLPEGLPREHEPTVIDEEVVRLGTKFTSKAIEIVA